MNIHDNQKSIADLLQQGTRLSAGKTVKTKKTHYPGGVYHFKNQGE